MTYWQLVVPQLLTGIGMPLFFIPLLGLSVASVPATQTASAAGLINFIRTMAGAFGTALSTTLWDNATVSARVDLTGKVQNSQSVLDTLQAHGLSLQQAIQNLSDMVQSQAVMLATNRVFFLLALTVAAVAAGVWLSPRPKAPVALPSAGH
jgi:DHA2 family multidrug resistance protein